MNYEDPYEGFGWFYCGTAIAALLGFVYEVVMWVKELP